MRDPNNPVARRAAQLAAQLAGQWFCEAYGPDAAGAGALCFVAEAGTRLCPSAGACAEVMTAERQRVFDLIQQKAATGDPDFTYLAGEFTAPGQLLGGAAGGPQREDDQ